MTINGVTQADVKRVSGIGRNLAGNLRKGTAQVGEGGLVFVVRGAEAKHSIETFGYFINNFIPQYKVDFRVIDQDAPQGSEVMGMLCATISVERSTSDLVKCEIERIIGISIGSAALLNLFLELMTDLTYIETQKSTLTFVALTMTPRCQESTFDTVRNCVSLQDVLILIANNRSNPTIRKAAAAYGMLLQASQSVRKTTHIEDSRYVVDQLSRAKTEIDIAAWHMPDVTEATGVILAAAQAFLDQETIGSTEWPTPNEVSATVANIASEIAIRR